MGTPEFSVPVLKSLNSSHKIISVFTQPPKKKSRGQKLIKSPVHLEAEKLDIPVRFPQILNNNEEFNYIKNSNSDFVVVVAYGQIIPDKFLKIKNLIFLNIHASLLPKWRGAAPIQRSIMAMDKETGISIMKIISKLDAGPYILQKKIKINPNDNFKIISEKLSELSSKIILKVLDLFKKGKVIYIKQEDKYVTYAKKINKTDSQCDWSMTAEKLIARINALSPSPGVWFKHRGNRIKIIKAKIANINGKKGEVLTDNLIVGCKDKAIEINLIQKEGKKILETKDFLLGYKIKKGEILS